MRRISSFSFFLVPVACVGCDHAAKHAAGALLAQRGPVSLLGDLLRFELAFNRGAFLSVGEALPEPLRHGLLIGLVPVLLAFLCVWFLRSGLRSRGQRIALGLLVGGGLGNWLDRVLHDGAVTDFVSLGLGGLRTGIFNLADLAVVAGMTLLLASARHRAETPGAAHP